VDTVRRISRVFGAFAVLMFAWQTGAQAQSACQNVNGAVCAPGSGVISTVHGDISVGRGDAITQASVGTGVVGGDRILARDGRALVRLGSSCLVPVGENSIASVTQQNGLTCLQKEALAPGAGFAPRLVGAGLVGVGAVAAAAVVLSEHSKSSGLSP
jgi:hypothetical protein